MTSNKQKQLITWEKKLSDLEEFIKENYQSEEITTHTLKEFLALNPTKPWTEVEEEFKKSFKTSCYSQKFDSHNQRQIVKKLIDQKLQLKIQELSDRQINKTITPDELVKLQNLEGEKQAIFISFKTVKDRVKILKGEFQLEEIGRENITLKSPKKKGKYSYIATKN